MAAKEKTVEEVFRITSENESQRMFQLKNKPKTKSIVWVNGIKEDEHYSFEIIKQKLVFYSDVEFYSGDRITIRYIF